MPRTLVISDLHLGLLHRGDVLRRPDVLEQLCAHLRERDVERLVLLGDVLELRHGPVRDALAAARPVLAALGAAVGEVVLLAGNHDHALVAPWLEDRGGDAAPPALTLDEVVPNDASPGLAAMAAALAPAQVTVRYPGIWLRDDVYATHGHYLDPLFTLPTIERLVAGMLARAVGPIPEQGAVPDDFEAQLAPMYAWTHAFVQGRGGAWSARGQTTSKRAWGAMTGTGRPTLRTRALAALFPLAIESMNQAGLGPLRPHLSGHALRQAGLRAFNDAIRRLGVEADHVVFGHTHRAGPLPGDPLHEWQGVRGARLWNCGSWTTESVLEAGGPDAPYYAGRGVELDDEGPPRLVRVVQDVGAVAQTPW